MSENGMPKKPLAADADSEGWREIAEKASNEKDPQKLIKLVEALCEKLDEREQRRKRLQHPSS